MINSNTKNLLDLNLKKQHNMSRAHNPSRESSPKHKGIKTSLYNNSDQLLSIQKPFINPNRIYVQTITQQPNVMPYINSQQGNQPLEGSSQNFIRFGGTHSEYIPIAVRQNNLMKNGTPKVIKNGVRISPLPVDLSKTKIQTAQQNRFYKAGSNFVPAPPESFLINSVNMAENRSPSIGKTNYTILNNPPPGPTNFQSVRKTFIPHHIINQIPVYSGSGSLYSDQMQYKQIGKNQQSQQLLLDCYSKLYTKYQTQKNQNLLKNQQLDDAFSQINSLKNKLQTHQRVAGQNLTQQPQKKKIINRQLLHDLLSQKWSKTVNEVISRRKDACLREISKMIESSKISIRIPNQIVGGETYYSRN